MLNKTSFRMFIYGIDMVILQSQALLPWIGWNSTWYNKKYLYNKDCYHGNRFNNKLITDIKEMCSFSLRLGCGKTINLISPVIFSNFLTYKLYFCQLSHTLENVHLWQIILLLNRLSIWEYKHWENKHTAVYVTLQ